MGKKSRQYTGVVLSNKMSKTIVVRSMHLSKHPKYNRIIRRYNKFKVHDEKGIAQAGDIVRIVQTRPLSKDKHYRLIEVLKKSLGANLEIKQD